MGSPPVPPVILSLLDLLNVPLGWLLMVVHSGLCKLFYRDMADHKPCLKGNKKKSKEIEVKLRIKKK